MSSDFVDLNFINYSKDKNNSTVVVFQKNVAADDASEIGIAWHLIENCGIGDNHPFQYNLDVDVNVKDSWGNYTPTMRAPDGSAFNVYKSLSGTLLETFRSGSSCLNVEVQNSLLQGSITANVYRSGKLISKKTGIAPKQKAMFGFRPVIFLATASEIEVGQFLTAGIITSSTATFSLVGLSSADIIMTGGGIGQNAEPFDFKLTNKKYD